MKSWALAAGLLALTISTGAMAADLDEGPPPDRYGAYDDPRYDDVYRHPAPPRGPYAGPPIPRERVYREHEEEEYEDRRPRRFSRGEPGPG